MRPRSFYIGFPPALVKVKRKGIEYGIGVIPLGGMVRIPGMNRPAARDLRCVSRAGNARGAGPRAGRAAPSAAPSTPRTTQARARALLRARARGRAPQPSRRARGARPIAALREVEEGTAPDAYWRAADLEARRRHRRRAARERPRRVRHPLRRLRHQRRARRSRPTPRSWPVSRDGTPAAAAGLQPGRSDRRRQRPARRRRSTHVSHLIRSSHGAPITLTGACATGGG